MKSIINQKQSNFMFYLIGVIITFFLAFILVSKSNKTVADKILFLWLLFIGIHLFLYYLVFSGKYLYYPYLLGINILLPLLHGPFLYLYTSAVTNQLKNWKISMLHFLPIIISYVSIADFFMLSNEKKKLVFENQGQGYETITLVIYISIFISGVVYVVWSLLLLKNHRKNILNQFSYSEKINLSWLRYLIFGVGLIWIFVILGNDKLLFSLVVLYVIFIGYFGINQVGVFSKKVPINVVNDLPIDNAFSSELLDDHIIDRQKPAKYMKSGLSKESAKEIHELLTKKFNEEKLFTNPELTLVELAEILKVHPNNLSQVINSFEQKNFYDYINSKRIDFFIELATMAENKKYTILSIAFDCGFNSKSSFNKYFKKVTNQTPSDYLSSINSKVIK